MELGLTRRNIGRLVLLAWAVALAWLARRQIGGEESVATAARATHLAPSAQFYAVYAGSQQIGQLNLSVDTLVDGVRLSELFVLDLPEGDTTRQLARGVEYSLTRSLRLRQFTRTIFGAGAQERLEGTLGADSILRLQHSEAVLGVASRLNMRVASAAALPFMLSYRAAFGGELQVGNRFIFPLLDVGAGDVRPVTVRVTAESTFVVPDSAAWDSVAARWVPATTDTLRAWKLEHDAPGANTVSWVDGAGSLVYEQTVGGLRYERSAFEIVRNNYRRQRRNEGSGWRRTIPGMVALTALKQAPDTTSDTLRFLVPPDSTFPGPSPSPLLGAGRQALRGDTLTVFRLPAADTSAHRIREANAAKGPGWDAPVLDGGVEAAAKEALRGAGSAGDSARALTLWVSRKIALSRTETASETALFTLRARAGTADGKARLLATLARASGISARLVSGLWVGPQGRSAHAWTELWVGRWVAADPTYGHYPASASLVRLLIGSASRPVDLLPVAGSARFLPLPSPR
ncbi:MAG: transglutaminase domain-containing protein [Gemmatimonadales bacterium]|nr:transglutaminase domain-containing protein [Gemmatimonadales bacterium]